MILDVDVGFVGDHYGELDLVPRSDFIQSDFVSVDDYGSSVGEGLTFDFFDFAGGLAERIKLEILDLGLEGDLTGNNGDFVVSLAGEKGVGSARCDGAEG